MSRRTGDEGLGTIAAGFALRGRIPLISWQVVVLQFSRFVVVLQFARFVVMRRCIHARRGHIVLRAGPSALDAVLDTAAHNLSMPAARDSLLAGRLQIRQLAVCSVVCVNLHPHGGRCRRGGLSGSVGEVVVAQIAVAVLVTLAVGKTCERVPGTQARRNCAVRRPVATGVLRAGIGRDGGFFFIRSSLPRIRPGRGRRTVEPLMRRGGRAGSDQ
mmetsp:Transcript_5412/g.13610  ORF Transcript_5412/g.13610 Transcript_5412/m.13610 type:complete len:215 (-) Transcript_5412:1118-1762(-)